MNKRDETIREKLLERLSAVDVDARNLAIEVATGSVIVRGSVPTEQQRTRTIEALAGAIHRGLGAAGGIRRRR